MQVLQADVPPGSMAEAPKHERPTEDGHVNPTPQPPEDMHAVPAPWLRGLELRKVEGTAEVGLGYLLQKPRRKKEKRAEPCPADSGWSPRP